MNRDASKWHCEQWTCHAPTTIFNEAGEVIAECTGNGQTVEVGIANAAQVVNEHNEYAALCAVAEAAELDTPEALRKAIDQLQAIRRAK